MKFYVKEKIHENNLTTGEDKYFMRHTICFVSLRFPLLIHDKQVKK